MTRPADAPPGLSELLSEAERRRRLSPTAIPLHAKQRVFVALPHLEALYGGAAGGGKTEALLASAFEFVGHRSYRCLILRRTYTALNLPDSIMHRALEWTGRKHWQEQSKRFVFPSGAIVQFGYCDSSSDLERYKSAQFHQIVIDEVTEWREEWYRFLFSRIRRRSGDVIPLRMRAATNPDGVGADWVRRRFGIAEGEVVKELRISADSETGEERAFLPATAEDNPSLDLAAYERSLQKLGSAKYQQLRFGRWLRDGVGFVYGDFRTEVNVIETPPVPRPGVEWNYIIGVDFGVVDPTAFAVLGWLPENPCVYVLESYSRADMSVTEAAEELKALHARYPGRIIGDTGGQGKAFEVEFRRRHALPVEAADKQNKIGYISLLNAAYREGKLKLVREKTEPLRREIEALAWVQSEGGGVKEDPGADNHCCDAKLYAWRAAMAFVERVPEPRPEGRAAEIRAELDEFWKREEAERAVAQNREWWEE